LPNVMSGICGVWRKENCEMLPGTLGRVSRGLSLAADERIEQATDRNAGLGISARFATQQMFSGTRIMVVCDAQLYNEEEIGSLAGPECQAVPQWSTAAALAALYERFGPDFVEKLHGDFSLILWDREKKVLLAALDGFGIHPLVCYEDRSVLMLASRADALIQSGDISPAINPRAIVNALNFTSGLAPETAFAGVRRLLPGTLLVATDGQQIRTRNYWDIRYDPESSASESLLSHELESVVAESVAAHCKGDSFETVGAFLSGGTDSSTVVGMMSRLGRGPVKTFSIGFGEESFNELEYARITARRFSADHHEFIVGPDECWEALPQMVRYFDEPFGNSSAIPTYFCARLAEQTGVKYLLAGDGGDELFGGNERYRTEKIFDLYQHLPWVLRKGIMEPALAALPIRNGLVGKTRNYIRRSNLPSPERYFSYHFLCANAAAGVFEKDFLTSLGGYSVLDIPSQYYRIAPARDHLDRLLYVDMKITLADNDLPKVTRMCELAGLQARFPFLSRPVAEFAGRIPPRLKVKGFEKRYLFKRAFRELLPVEVIKKAKHGFGIPVATWLRTDRRFRELSHDLMLSPRFFARGYFRRDFIEDLFRKNDSDDGSYYGDTLWTLLALELWHRNLEDHRVQVDGL